MINPKRLVQLARKWQKLVAIRRRRISISRTLSSTKMDASRCKAVADKGHFVVYTIDRMRFVVPLAYLNSPVFKELFKMSEDEFGLPCSGPIALPCDAIFMEYILLLIRVSASKNVEKALPFSIGGGRCATASLAHGLINHQTLLHGF
ncbi:auxin-responsive protein SAUR68-like [Magnolia sinica]|uniref:auxin-responsive protein SAUR68-like n=1 Tax=Magnolia sinica TaxID=86752 RepID=UPI002658B1DE|nr:auxin-responsive protein SAUR68-like [Magnolia sinica]